MRLKVIACEVLRRELYHVAARATAVADVVLLPQGLHENSDTCRSRLQAEVDATPPDRYDAVLLGYGLCSNALVGVRAPQVPLVVPRAHDCVTLLLGSKERYRRLFEERPGTYWFSSGWLECREKEGEPIAPRPASGLGPGGRWLGLGPDGRLDLQDLAHRYGEDNARYLAEVLGGWERAYTRGALIRFPFDRHLGLEEKVRRICREKGWTYAEVDGNLGLLEAALNPPEAGWDPARFLTVAPGGIVRASFDDRILSAEPAAAIGCAACQAAGPAATTKDGPCPAPGGGPSTSKSDTETSP